MLINPKKSTLKKLSKQTSIVGFGTTFIGNLRCGKDLYVAGRVEGDIEASDDAIIEIGDTGEVKGEIKGDSVLIYGTVDGDVSAIKKLEIGSSARVTGRLSYSLLKLEPGAVFEGELEHQDVDRGEISQ